MTQLEINCLHGTLQDPTVWRGLAAALSDAGVDVTVVAEEIALPSSGGPAEWAESFCRRVRSESSSGQIGAEADVADPRRVLLGYSLGGRLALHAVLADPTLWSRVVVVAAHPGTADEVERRAILERDATWAGRCRESEWETLLADWDRLPVFAGHPNTAPRDPGAWDRERHARIFEALSRGNQADLRPALVAAGDRLPPILYVTGRADAAYSALGAELARGLTTLQHMSVAGAGHRVPWEQPAAFANLVAGFLSGGAIGVRSV